MWQVLGGCALVDDVAAMEAYQPADLLLPPVRVADDIGLPLPQAFLGEWWWW